MNEVTLTWNNRQALLHAFARDFARPGIRGFAEWITATAINVEVRAVSHSASALDQPSENGSSPPGKRLWRSTHETTMFLP